MDRIQADLSPRDHAVKFYQDERELVRIVGSYLTRGDASGASMIVAATDAHVAAFEEMLASSNVDVEALRASGRLVTLDAAEIASRLGRGAAADARVFESVVGDLVRDTVGRGAPVRIYGEIVAILWDAGHVATALEIEELWNGLGTEVPFSLLCAYPTHTVGDPRRHGDVDHVCRLHSAIVDTEPEALASAGEDGWVSAEEARRFERAVDAPRRARRFAAEALARWGMDDLADQVSVVVTELATNALVHADSDFGVTLRRRLDSVHIAVDDASTAVPTVLHWEPTRLSGRGLPLVGAIAERWGHHVHDGGKVVWADVIRGAATDGTSGGAAREAGASVTAR